MLKVAVCDDEDYIVDLIEEYVLRFGKENNMDFKIYKFYEGEALIKSEMRFDLVFLDIMMNQLDGIETGKILKDRYMKTQIVYISSFPDYSMRAHKVHAFDYVTKPISYSNIEDVLNDLKKLNSNNHITDDFIRLKLEDYSEIMLNTDDILYFEYCESRKIYVYTTDGKIIKVNDTLFDILKRVNQAQFVQPYKAYIVNMKYVRKIAKGSKSIFMVNGVEIGLSGRKQKEFMEKFHSYMRV